MRTRPRITWLIGGGVVALLLLAGVDALRSSFSETSARVTSTETSGSGKATSAAEEYVAQAQVICGSASSEVLRTVGPEVRSGAPMDEVLTWYSAAVLAAQHSLAELRSIASLPEADQALVNRFHSAMEHEIDLLRKVVGAALFGDGRRVRRFAARRVVATQRKGVVVGLLSARWHLDLEPLLNCPLMLSG